MKVSSLFALVVRVRRFAFMMAWTFRAAWTISPLRVTVLILVGIIARLATMGAFMLAIGAINFVISQPHRLQFMEKHGLSGMPELAFALTLTALVAGTFLLSVVLGLWRRQAGEMLTDMLAKSFQKQLFQRFKDETRRLAGRADFFTGLYAVYSRTLERQLPVALKVASGNVIDLCMNLVTLTITLGFLLFADSFALVIVVGTISMVSLIYMMASRSHRQALAVVRRKTTTSSRERLNELRWSTPEARTAEFWSRLDAEHEQEFSSHLESISPANRIHSMRGWSMARILSNPAILNPVTAAIIFAALILNFFERSQTEAIDLHHAIIIVFLARFALVFGNAVSMDMRKFSERYATIVLCHEIAAGRSTVLENLSTSIKNVDPSEVDPENEAF